MDVRAKRRVHPIVAKVVPALPMKPGANLHDPHVVVGIAEPEPADLRLMLEDHPAAEAEPAKDSDRDPMRARRNSSARAPNSSALPSAIFPALAARPSTANSRDMATRLNFPSETVGQLVRFAIVGFSLAARLFGHLLVSRDVRDAARRGGRDRLSRLGEHRFRPPQPLELSRARAQRGQPTQDQVSARSAIAVSCSMRSSPGC